MRAAGGALHVTQICLCARWPQTLQTAGPAAGRSSRVGPRVSAIPAWQIASATSPAAARGLLFRHPYYRLIVCWSTIRSDGDTAWLFAFWSPGAAVPSPHSVLHALIISPASEQGTPCPPTPAPPAPKYMQLPPRNRSSQVGRSLAVVAPSVPDV